MSKELKTYNAQKRRAKQRGISWEFTYQEWLIVWQNSLGLNWFDKRGKAAGQYCMARIRDVGPYSPTNVKIITGIENSKETVFNGSSSSGGCGEKNKHAKLTKSQVLAIQEDKRRYKSIAADYSISYNHVWRIKAKRKWKHLQE